MKRLLLATVAVLVLIAGTAKADPLPNVYLGRWCFIYETVLIRKECHNDGAVEIRRDGYSMHEQECKYASIKYTGEKSPASTKPRKEDWIPVVRIVAHCKGEGETWKEQRELRYYKGDLIVKPTSENN
jgi:hypothetical protein